MKIISLADLKAALGTKVTDSDNSDLTRLIEDYSVEFEAKLNRKLEKLRRTEWIYVPSNGDCSGLYYVAAAPIFTAPGVTTQLTIVRSDDGTTQNLKSNTDFSCNKETGEINIFSRTAATYGRVGDRLRLTYTGGYDLSAPRAHNPIVVGWSDSITPTQDEYDAATIETGLVLTVPESNKNGFIFFYTTGTAPENVHLDGNKHNIFDAFQRIVPDPVLGGEPIKVWITNAAQDASIMGTGTRTLTLDDPEGAAASEEGVVIFPQGDAMGAALRQAMIDQCRVHWTRRANLEGSTIVAGDATTQYTNPSRLLTSVERVLETFFRYETAGL